MNVAFCSLFLTLSYHSVRGIIVDLARPNGMCTSHTLTYAIGSVQVMIKSSGISIVGSHQNSNTGSSGIRGRHVCTSVTCNPLTPTIILVHWEVALSFLVFRN